MDIGSDATISVTLELRGVAESERALKQFGATAENSAAKTQAAFARSEAAARQLAAAEADFARAGANAAQIAQLTGTSMDKARQAVQLYGRTLAQTELEVQGLAAAQREMAVAGFGVVEKAAVRVGPGLNSVRSAMTSLAASALSTAPGVAQLSGVLGSMALGTGLMIGVLAGVAALGFAWDKLTEGARKAKEEHQKFLDVLIRLRDEEKFSMENVVRMAQLDRDLANAKLDSLKVERAALEGREGLGLARVATDAKIIEQAKKVAELDDLLARGNKKLYEAGKEILDKQTADTKRAADAERQSTEAAKRAHEEWQQIVLAQIPALKDLNVQRINSADTIDRVTTATMALLNAAKAGGQIAPRKGVGIPGLETLPTEHLFDIPQWSQGLGELRGEFRRGINDMVTDGLRSFEGFFGSVLTMFRRMMARMEELGKQSGFGYKALGLGSAGIAGGLVGYQVGQQAGSYGAGILGGAASGAAAGSVAGPWGAVIGGLVGAGAGLLGAAKAQEEAARQLRDAATAARRQENDYVFGAATGGNSVLGAREANRRTFNDLYTQLYNFHERAAISEEEYQRRRTALFEAYHQNAERIEREFWDGIRQSLNSLSGPAGEFNNAVKAINDSYNVNIETARRLGASQDQLNEIEALRIAQLTQLVLGTANLASVTSSLLGRMDSIVGGGGMHGDPFASIRQAIGQAVSLGMNDLAEALRTELRLDEQFSAYLDGIERMNRAAEREVQIAEEQKQIAQAQLGVLQETQQTLEESVANTRQTVEALARFSDSLKLGPLTSLSPVQQYQEAKAQYDRIAVAAAGGDQASAQRIPEYAQRFLEASRDMFASSGRYGQDYNQVQTLLGALQDQYGTQLSVAERHFAEAQRQTKILEQQLGVGKDQARQQLIDTQINQLKSAIDYGVRFGGSNGINQPSYQLAAHDLQLMTLFFPGMTLEEIRAMLAASRANANQVVGNTPEEQERNAAADRTAEGIDALIVEVRSLKGAITGAGDKMIAVAQQGA